MITAQDIRTTTFELDKRGYNTSDVDSYLNKVASEYEVFQQSCAQMLAEKDQELTKLKADKADMEQKMLVLADKIEDYRRDENIVRNALINAEKLKENLLSEAQQTADILIKDAQAKADKIVESATTRLSNEQDKYLRIQQEVVRFKDSLVSMYKEHIKLISELPENGSLSLDDIKATEEDEEETSVPCTEPEEECVYATDIPDLTADVEEPAEEVKAEDNLVEELTNELIDNASAPVNEEAEDKKQNSFSRFNFGDKFGF